MKGKKYIIRTLVISILILILDLSGPLWIDDFKFDLSVSIAGTIISSSALIIAVIEINGIKEANKAIKSAVKENSNAIRRMGNVYDIARHVQMINEIHGMVSAKKWEIAHLRMLELYSLLGNIKSNIQEYGIELREIERHINNISEDLKTINRAINGNSIFSFESILDHLDSVSPTLNTICTNLKTKGNDNKSA